MPQLITVVRTRFGRKPMKITHNGESLTLEQWADKLGRSKLAIYQRLRQGLPYEIALAPKGTKFYTHDGETLSLEQWSERLGVPAHRVKARLKNGLKKRGDHPAAHLEVYTYNGDTLAIWEWASRLGIKETTIIKRLQKGLPSELVFSPRRVCGSPKTSGEVATYTFDGHTHTLPEWAERLGVRYNTLYQRLQRGYPYERVFRQTVGR